MENFRFNFRDPTRPSPHHRRRLRLLALSLVLVASIIGSAYAVNLFLFNQNFPSYTGAASGIKQGCASLQANVGNTPPSGWIEYNCPGPVSAFTVSTAGSYLPIFTLPNSYTALYVNTVNNCASSGLTQITSNLSVTLPVMGYDYCAHYTVTGPLQPFNVTWYQ